MFVDPNSSYVDDMIICICSFLFVYWTLSIVCEWVVEWGGLLEEEGGGPGEMEEGGEKKDSVGDQGGGSSNSNNTSVAGITPC